MAKFGSNTKFIGAENIWITVRKLRVNITGKFEGGKLAYGSSRPSNPTFRSDLNSRRTLKFCGCLRWSYRVGRRLSTSQNSLLFWQTRRFEHLWWLFPSNFPSRSQDYVYEEARKYSLNDPFYYRFVEGNKDGCGAGLATACPWEKPSSNIGAHQWVSRVSRGWQFHYKLWFGPIFAFKFHK